MRNRRLPRSQYPRICLRASKTRTARARHGATLIETAFTVVVFFTMVLGMIDLSVAVQRYNSLAHATRSLARQCVVHGALADQLGVWGPTAYSAAANVNAAIPNALGSSLAGLDPASVTVSVQWPDGGNDVRNDDRVRVILTSSYTPMTTLMFGSNTTIPLRAESTLPIVH